MYHTIHVHALSLFSIFWCNEIKDGVLSFFPHCYISRYFLDTLWNKSYWLMISLFFLQNLSWHINGMKEHNQNFSLGIQIHVSFIWSILGIFLLLEIWSKLVIFYWNMICFIIIEKSFSVRISFLVTSFWNDICRTNFWDYDIKEVQELSLLTYILWICVAIWRQFVVVAQMCSHNVPFTPPPLICWNNHCYVQSSGCIISIVLVEQHLIFFNYISFRIYRNIFTYVQWCWV